MIVSPWQWSTLRLQVSASAMTSNGSAIRSRSRKCAARRSRAGDAWRRGTDASAQIMATANRPRRARSRLALDDEERVAQALDLILQRRQAARVVEHLKDIDLSRLAPPFPS